MRIRSLLSVGPTPGGAVAELAVGRAAAAPRASGGASARPATQGIGGAAWACGGSFGWRWGFGACSRGGGARSSFERKVRFLVCVCLSCRLTCCVYKGRLMAYVRVPCVRCGRRLVGYSGDCGAVDGRARLREPRSSRLGKLPPLDTVSGQRCPTLVHHRPLTVFAAY